MFVCAFVCPLVLCVHSFAQWVVLFVYSCMFLLVHYFVCLFIHSFVGLFFAHSIICWMGCSFILLSIFPSIHSVPCVVPAGVPAAVRGGSVLPADTHGERAGALETGPGAAADGSALRVPGGAGDP